MRLSVKLVQTCLGLPHTRSVVSSGRRRGCGGTRGGHTSRKGRLSGDDGGRLARGGYPDIYRGWHDNGVFLRIVAADRCLNRWRRQGRGDEIRQRLCDSNRSGSRRRNRRNVLGHRVARNKTFKLCMEMTQRRVNIVRFLWIRGKIKYEQNAFLSNDARVLMIRNAHYASLKPIATHRSVRKRFDWMNRTSTRV